MRYDETFYLSDHNLLGVDCRYILDHDESSCSLHFINISINLDDFQVELSYKQGDLS